MTGQTIVAGAVQLSGIVLAPLLVGIVQWLKARAQGRRGASALQPYRELRRLWRRSGVRPQPSTWVYDLAVPLSAAATLLALRVLPVASASPDWGLGHDALVLFALLAIGRFALAAAAWDTGSGFELMGAARELTFAVFVEGLLLVVLALLAFPAHSTDLLEIGPQDLAACAHTAQRIAARAKQVLGADGVNLLNSCGADAWQTVFHFHIHVIPRYAGDPLRLPWIPAAGDPDEIAAAGAALREA